MGGGHSLQNISTETLQRTKEQGGLNLNILGVREHALQLKFIAWVVNSRGTPGAGITEFYIGSRIRELVPFRNNIPHSSDIPVFYKGFLGNYLKIKAEVKDWGTIDTKSLYEILRNKEQEVWSRMVIERDFPQVNLKKTFKGIQGAKTTSRVCTTNWKIAHQGLYTGDFRLRKIGRDNNNGICFMCGRKRETLEHLLVECEQTKALWGELRTRFKIANKINLTGWEIIFRNFEKVKGENQIAANHLVSCVNDTIWRYRNGVREGDIKSNVQALTNIFYSKYWEKRRYDFYNKSKSTYKKIYDPYDNG